jgi:hypothetical protein
MKLQIFPSDKIIILDGRTLDIKHGDLSWISNDVLVFRWDDSSGEGEIEYWDKGGNETVNEIGIYSKAVEIFNKELEILDEDERIYDESRDWNEIFRIERNVLLSQSDWVVVKAKETGTNIPAAWKTYRQALRDLPATIEPENYSIMCKNSEHASWPTPPSPNMS